MELETFVQTLRLQKKQKYFGIKSDPAAKRRLMMMEWISARKQALCPADAIQVPIDAAETGTNHTDNPKEFYRLGRQCLALEWLQGALRRARAG
ncbi:MAG: hypothetical protein ABI347_01255 [Nitrososphaera sp.]|jgi:hypothetical protein